MLQKTSTTSHQFDTVDELMSYRSYGPQHVNSSFIEEIERNNSKEGKKESVLRCKKCGTLFAGVDRIRRANWHTIIHKQKKNCRLTLSI